MNSFLVNWKSSINGILAFLITTGTVLLATGNALFSAHITLYITIGLALCRAYVGLIEKDADAQQPAAPSAPSSTASTLKSIVVLMLAIGMCAVLTGCPGSTLHKASAAADSIASSLQTAENINRDAFSQGIESAQERDAIGAYISNGAKANDAFIASIQAAETSGATTAPQAVISAFGTLVTQLSALNSEGVLQLKSAQAQQEFQIVVTAIQTQLAVLQAIMKGPAAPSPLPPPSAHLFGPAASSPVPPPALMPAPVCEPATPCKLHGRFLPVAA